MPAKKKSAAKKTPNGGPAAKSATRKLRVRTYRHGLGDCHLLSFTKADGSLLHMLVDCGIVRKAPSPKELMTPVARDIAQETGGAVDIVVATHQHWDHLSGFEQARPEFAAVQMKRLWLAWTENKDDPLVRKIRRELGSKLAAVRAAAAQLAQVGSARAIKAADRIEAVLDFFGPGVKGEETQAILDWLRTRVPDRPQLLEPGTVFVLDEVPNVRVYVLGPPRNLDDIKIEDPRKTKRESYELTFAAAADGLAAALGHGNADAEFSQPFEARYRRSAKQAEANPFFQEHYFAKDPERPNDPNWRQIGSDWLEMAEQLALYLNRCINNTSLALAFEFIDTGEVVLFPGDAQIGSWLSWHRLAWQVKDADGTKRKVTVQDLFARTVFYKASHHASHNGTLSGRGENQTGLEQMTNPELVCVVPVDRAMSEAEGWSRTLPWQPLLDRLAEKTRGRLILTDQNETPPDPKKLTALSAAERTRFAQQVAVTKGWVDFTL
ncbi:MAG TPA: hypothetical protein VF551_01720 [Chthoniobacterales bacterium]